MMCIAQCADISEINKPETPVKVDEFRDKIGKFEESMAAQPGAMFNDCFPLSHLFGKGLYVRQITMPPGAVIVSKIHRHDHPYFVMKGKCTVVTESGKIEIEAPFFGMTKAGTKRALMIHEETVWITVHATEETDLDKIEEEIIAKTFNDLMPDLLNGEPFTLIEGKIS